MYAYVLARLDASKGSLPSVAVATGISHRSLEKIARRVVKNPGVHTVEKLNTYFRSLEAAA
jgi:hypothetical protein